MEAANNLEDDFSHIPVPLNYTAGEFHCTLADPSQLLSSQLESYQVLGAMSKGIPYDCGTGQTDPPASLANTAGRSNHAEDTPMRDTVRQPHSTNVRTFEQQAEVRLPSSTFTAQDLVRQIQQPSPSPLHTSNGHASHRTSLPGIFQTPFTPLPGEIPNSGSRPSTAHQAAPPSTAPAPPSRGSIEFQQQLAQMQHNIQARTSPIASIDPTPSSYYETPTGLNTFILHQPESSPWERSMTTPSIEDTAIPKRAPRASPFGAIGEARPKNAKTPTSGQPG